LLLPFLSLVRIILGFLNSSLGQGNKGDKGENEYYFLILPLNPNLAIVLHVRFKHFLNVICLLLGVVGGKVQKTTLRIADYHL
jgi:hypothetical protein